MPFKIAMVELQVSALPSAAPSSNPPAAQVTVGNADPRVYKIPPALSPIINESQSGELPGGDFSTLLEFSTSHFKVPMVPVQE